MLPRSAFSPEHSDEQHFCFLPSAKGAGCVVRNVESTARVARDLCLRCMLLLGIAACGDTSEMLDDALSEIDVQDAEHFVGELGPTFPVVRSTSESTPQTERQCAEKLTF
jgi:hypothetical protein